MLFFKNVGEFLCDATVDELMTLVATFEFWTWAIFDVQCSTLNKHHYESMYLQLIFVRHIDVET